MTTRRFLAVLFMVVLGISLSIPAGAADEPSKRVLNVQALYNYLIFGNNAPVYQNPNLLAPLFAPTTQGRIAPLGEGHDLATVEKLFLGISPTSSGGALGTVTGVTFPSIKDLGSIVIVEADVSFAVTAGPEMGLIYQLRETGSFTFNKQFQIVSFDLSIPYFDSAMAQVGLQEPAADPVEANQMLQEVCALAMGIEGTGAPGLCNTANTGYANTIDCVNYLSSIPAGIWNNVSSNTVICRAYRLPFVLFDPTNECPNMGKTGAQCVDTPYSNYFSETF